MYACIDSKERGHQARCNFLQQQDRFDQFIDYYNNERPHHYPAELYDLAQTL